MSPFLGPLDAEGSVPAHQQTRVAAFLMSVHGAQARQLAAALPGGLHNPWQMEIHVQYCREMEILSLLARATSWVPDPALAFLTWKWEAAWLPKPVPGMADWQQGLLIDLAAFGHALHAGLRPAALLPEDVSETGAFALALRRIEFESVRLMQAQIAFLKDSEHGPLREVVDATVERRHAELRTLFADMLRDIGVETSERHLVEPAFVAMSRAGAAQGRS